MAWTQQLYETYENLSNQDCGLTPIAHMYAKAQLEVTLNQEGEFVSAVVIAKDNEQTLIPVTESSSGRSSGSAPHALNDTLSYVAGDFALYADEGKQKTAQKKHADYIRALDNWCKSEYSGIKIQTIYNYINKDRLIEDLVLAGIVHLENGRMTKEKIGNQEYEKVLVRFRVLHGDETRTWKDQELISKYTSYYLSTQKGTKDICLITGKMETISENHPKNIVSAYGNAKLLSANDSSGFTFRGRFDNSQQACTVSYEASQKIHGALKWLATNQGRMVGSKNRRIFVCWNPKGKDTGHPFEGEAGFDDEEEEYKFAENQKVYKQKLDHLLSGVKEHFESDDLVIVMAMDAATTGRLSITYYQELLASTYWDNISYWLETANWYYLKFDNEKKPHQCIETMPLWKIVSYAFGTERESGNYKNIEADDGVLREHVQRLVKCMVERQRIPRDIILSLYQKASTPLAYSPYNRNLVLSTACALIHKDLIDRGLVKEDNKVSMKLDTNNSDRSYLFGRLLAVYEKVERVALGRDEDRETNAIRFQSAFANHPLQTWNILEQAAIPYFGKLSIRSREYYKGIISEITASFSEKDAERMNQSLSETYLLGYYLQRMELNTRKNAEEDKENE